MEEIHDISKAIDDKIKLLELGRKELNPSAEARANAVANYDKVLGMTLLKLRNNAIPEHDGFPVTDLPVSIMEKVAKAMVYKEKIESEKCELMYRNVVTKLDKIESELNGKQSIFRHLSVT